MNRLKGLIIMVPNSPSYNQLHNVSDIYIHTYMEGICRLDQQREKTQLVDAPTNKQFYRICQKAFCAYG